ncbi:MAG: hypothetical protein GXO73_06930, partial [Calditrichaeota bacterium]|nr:hypothetical protein [Calditrichota bacterium]
MALSGVSPALANRLVETALEHLDHVQPLPEGRWQLVEGVGKPVRNVRFVCLAVQRSSDASSTRVGWSVVEDGTWSPGAAVTLSAREQDEAAVPLLLGAEPVVFARREAGVSAALAWVRGLSGAVERVWELRRAVENLFPGQVARE